MFPDTGSGASQIGTQSDTTATWWNSTASLISLIKLMIAQAVGAGSRTYNYTGTNLTSETWTLLGTTRTKTYTYTNGVLTAETDWV